MTPHQSFSCHTVLNYFLGKVTNAQLCSSKIKYVRAKNLRGGLLKPPPPLPDRIGLSSHEYKITIVKLITASSNIFPAFTKTKSKKNKDNFVEIEFLCSQFDLKLLPTFMGKFGYP